MDARITWLDDPEVFGINKLVAHSDHSFYATQEEMLSKISSLKQNLDGTWQFAYANSAEERIVDFYQPDYDISALLS